MMFLDFFFSVIQKRHILQDRKNLKSIGIDTFDSIQTKVEFENGVIVNFDNSWILPKGFAAFTNQGLKVVGTEGICEIDSQNRGIEECTSEKKVLKPLTHILI